MIVTAGTLYRIRKLTKHLSRTQIKDIMIKYGFASANKKEYPSILPRPI